MQRVGYVDSINCSTGIELNGPLTPCTN